MKRATGGIFIFNVLFKSETCKFVYTLFTVLMFLHVHITLSQDLFSAKSRLMSFVYLKKGILNSILYIHIA